jgi:hypothetical protein
LTKIDEGAALERPIVSQKFFDIELRVDGIAWLKRTPTPYSSITEVHQAYDYFLTVVDDWLLTRRIKSGSLGTRRRTPMGWLYDVRAATSQRNDPEFEEVIQKRRADLLERSPLLVVVVKTAAGRMQVARLARDGSSNLRITHDAEDAIDWLRAELSKPS